MTLARVCACGQLHPGPGPRCPTCERERNRQPHRARHRTKAHRQLRAAVLRRDHRCVDCGTTHDLTLDYIIPLQDGGTMSLNNAATRCRSCNSRAGRRARPLFRPAPAVPRRSVFLTEIGAEKPREGKL